MRKIASLIISLLLVISFVCKAQAVAEEKQPLPQVTIKPDMPAAEKQQDIIDIKPLEKLRIDYAWWAMVTGGTLLALLLIAGGIFYYRKRQNRKEKVIEIPPHEAALAELNRLKAIKCTDAEAIKKLYFELSEVFRRYLEGRYHFPATDWTAEEIAYHINQSRDLNPELKERSKSFLSNTDIVKFAEYIPGAEQIKQELERAIWFVEATKEVPVEEGAAADAL